MKFSGIVSIIMPVLPLLCSALPVATDVAFSNNDLAARAAIDDLIDQIAADAIAWAEQQAKAGVGDYRSLYTDRIVSQVEEKAPQTNVVVCVADEQYKLNLPGAGTISESVSTNLVNSVTFTTWYFGKGQTGNWFERTGDGGYINWEVGGCFTRTGDLVTFC